MLRKPLITIGLTGAIRVANVLLTLATSVLLARILGIEEFGQYVFLYSLILIISIPARMGLPQLVLRETAYAKREDATGKIRGIWRWATRTAMGISLVITAVVAAVVYFSRETFPDPGAALAALVLIPLISLGNLRSAALRGIGKVVSGQLPELLLRPLFFVIVLAIVFLRSPPQGLTAIDGILINAGSALAAFLVGTAMLLFTMRGLPRQNIEKFGDRSLILSAMSLGMIAGLTAINNNLDIVMIRFWLTERDVGLYRPASALSDVAMFGVQIINVVIMPRVASLFKGGQIKELESLVRKATWAGGSSGFIGFVVLATFGEILLAHLYGPDFVGGYIPLVILGLGQAVNASFGAAAGLLNMSGFENRTLRAISIAIVVNVVLNAVLMKFMGINGAALATLTAVWTYKVLLTRDIKKLVGVRTNLF